MSRQRPRVLFLDRSNASRTLLAEALLRHYAGDQFEACSAGLAPTVVHPHTRTVLAEIGVCHADLRAKRITEFLAKQAVSHAIVLSEPGELDSPRIYPFARHVDHWSIPDPERVDAAEPDELQRFRHARDAIAQQIQQWLHELPMLPALAADATRLKSSALLPTL